MMLIEIRAHMKTLINKTILLTLLLTSLSAKAQDMEVLFKEINKIVKNVEIYHYVKGDNAEEKVYELAREIDNDEPMEFQRNRNIAPEFDGIAWGTLTLKGAISHVKDMESMNAITSRNSELIELYLIQMQKIGAEFGFSPNRGGSVCGASFPSLFIFKIPSDKVYELKLFGFPDC